MENLYHLKKIFLNPQLETELSERHYYPGGTMATTVVVKKWN
jgi:hypothetical protein